MQYLKVTEYDSLTDLAKALGFYDSTWIAASQFMTDLESEEVYIAVLEGQVRGLIVGECGVCHFIGVHKNYRRQGIATGLVEQSGLSKPYSVSPTLEALGFWDKALKLLLLEKSN
jgi:GNAT superfamily N-acetyltransferase